MTTKTSKLAAMKRPETNKLVATFPVPVEQDKADALAQLALRPSVNAAAVIVEYAKVVGEQDVGSLAASLQSEMKDVLSGDRKQAESMLFGQVHALQAIFMNFSRRALKQDYQKNLESFLRLGLKAQNQCRMTLETLATIKNPPVVFARQTNINNGGQQQVNNGTPGIGDPSPAANPLVEQTELLEANDGERVDRNGGHGNQP